MEFSELTKKEFGDFIKNHELSTFLQSIEMEGIYDYRGRKYVYVGIKRNKKVVAATRMVIYDSRFNKKSFYAARGLIVDYKDRELLIFFARELKKYIKKNNGIQLKINPPIILQERDIDGNIVDGGINNQEIVNNLLAAGFKRVKPKEGIDLSTEIRWGFALDVKGKTKEEVFANFKQNHRNRIHRSEKNGVKIRELGYDELDKFKAITQSTGERRNFADKPLEYYQAVYKSMVEKGLAKFIVAYIIPKEYLKSLEDELDEIKKRKAGYANNNSSIGKIKEADNNIALLEKRIEEAKEMINIGDEIILSAALFMMNNKKIYYMFSGSDDKYMNLCAQFIIQWYIIQYAIDNKYDVYDFYGISSVFDKNDPEYGVYEFKKGFGGYVYEYIGDYELPITYHYYINKVIRAIKKLKH